jgi:hypothetical protein
MLWECNVLRTQRAFAKSPSVRGLGGAPFFGGVFSPQKKSGSRAPTPQQYFEAISTTILKRGHAHKVLIYKRYRFFFLLSHLRFLLILFI